MCGNSVGRERGSRTNSYLGFFGMKHPPQWRTLPTMVSKKGMPITTCNAIRKPANQPGCEGP